MVDKEFRVYMTRTYVDFRDYQSPIKRVFERVVAEPASVKSSFDVFLSPSYFEDASEWPSFGFRTTGQEFLTIGKVERKQSNASDRLQSLKI